MTFVVRVPVKLPDGTVRWLPVVNFDGAEERVAEFNSQKDADEWTLHVLPWKARSGEKE